MHTQSPVQNKEIHPLQMFSLEEQVAEPANMDKTSKSFQELNLGYQKTKQERKKQIDRAEFNSVS